MGDRAAQRKINIAVDRDIKRITDIADKGHSESVRARGVLRRIFDQNKKIAAAEIKALRKKAATAAELKNAKALFASRLTTLTNTVVANAGKFRRHLNRVTGVARSWKKASAADRKAIRAERNGMFSDLNKALARAIQLGEARAKKVQEEAQANIASTKRSLTSQIAVKTEMMADNVYKIIQGKRQKIADNYLSLKAYAAVAK